MIILSSYSADDPLLGQSNIKVLGESDISVLFFSKINFLDILNVIKVLVRIDIFYTKFPIIKCLFDLL